MKRTLYYNGNILTMDNDCPTTQAVLVSDGIIEKTGTFEELYEYSPADTEIFDLNGHTLMPSFIDPHSHITSVARTLELVQLSAVTSFDDIIEEFKKYIQKKKPKPGEWLIGFGYDNNTLKEHRHPTKELLDKISKENPVMITHTSGHMGVLNSAALRECGIISATQAPASGVIGKDENGEPNGYLEETAFISITSKTPAPTLEKQLELLSKAQEIYLSNGITTIQDGMVKEPEFSLLKTAAQKGLLKADVVGYADMKNAAFIYDDNREYHRYNGKFRLGGYKIFLDGSPQGKTAWLSQPYENSDGYKGYPVYSDDELTDFIDKAIKTDTQLLAHCNGDAACQQYIDCTLKACKINKVSRPLTYFNRPVMIHAQLLRRDQLSSVRELGITPSFFVAHTYYWGDIHIENLGKERADEISPAKSASKNGIIYTFHQDSPVIMPDMLQTVWCAVNRKTKSGVTLGENERVSVWEALKAVTVNAAYQYGEEYKKGTITPSKCADLIILDKNPLTVPKDEIKDIKVLMTIKDGKCVYKK